MMQKPRQPLSLVGPILLFSAVYKREPMDATDGRNDLIQIATLGC